MVEDDGDWSETVVVVLVEVAVVHSSSSTFIVLSSVWLMGWASRPHRHAARFVTNFRACLMFDKAGTNAEIASGTLPFSKW